MSARKKGCLGCGGALVVAFIALAVIGAIIGSHKKTSTNASASTSPSAPSTASPSSKPPATHHQAPPPPAKPKSLAHGPQQGLTGCIISYKDAQKGSGTSTFTAIVLDASGKPYSPTSSPYSVLYQLDVAGSDGTSYSATEALGSGSRTAADNGGSDWSTVQQGDAEVTANSTQGMVLVTVPAPLAQVKSVQGSIMVTSQKDENYLKQAQCAVRPA